MKFQFVNVTKVLEQNASNFSFFRKIMFVYYTPIIKKELKLAQLNSGEKVLFIGGGYMPCSAILFQKLSDTNITIIDNDEDTICYAKHLIDSLNLNDKITIKYCDGKEMVIKEFDMVHIAMQVSPKNSVFKHVYKNMKNGAKLLIRQPKDHLQKGYNIHICGEKPKASINQVNYSNMKRTVLYVK